MRKRIRNRVSISVLSALFFILFLVQSTFAGLTTRSGNEVSQIGFGTDGIRDSEIFKNAIREGYRLFDSADLYENSDELAQAIQDSGVKRDEIFLNYKILPKVGKEKFIDSTKRAIEKFGHIDSLMLHDLILPRDLGNISPEDYLVELFQELEPYLKAGKIRYLGLSNVNPRLFEKLLNRGIPIQLVQNQFNQYCRDEENRSICKRENVHYMGYGIFGGKAEGDEGMCARALDVYQPHWNVSKTTFPVMNLLAQKYGVTPNDVLLAWSIHQGTMQIPKTRDSGRMKSNLQAELLAKKILPEDLDRLEKEFQVRLSPEDWKSLQEKAQSGDRLAQIKRMSGNYLVRHRLIDELYREGSLKQLFDQISQYEAEFVQPALVNNVMHYLEEGLRYGQFDEIHGLLRQVSESTQGERGKKSLLGLLRDLGKNGPLFGRTNQLRHFIHEEEYVKKNGNFKIVQPATVEKKIRSSTLVELVFVGKDKKIFVLPNVPTSTTLAELDRMLVKRYPSEFTGPQRLRKFYVRDADRTDKNFSAQSGVPLYQFMIADGDILGVGASPEEIHHLNRFYHHPIQNPEFFQESKP